ncbi:protein SET DOMAIN GROUP 40 isoform X2 [Rhodamnia argentea]|uniref:Protein SET DOMAIN GROUP 40 isoform X2 n=1 Tax=Rhodamnia argentea TaxID=178133 RepID=A0A8B8NUJ7_9MYRT|nr:protein SET DOMAIN GROUP 40 isoform X2 [Rhodamnia argentea]
MSVCCCQESSLSLLRSVGKGKKSWWYPYLKNLPKCYSTLPTFRQFEVQAFQEDDAIWVAKKAKWKAEAEWKEARVLMEELKFKPTLLTFKSWLWASSTISSRTLHVPWDEAGCLCPVGDLFNYAAPGGDLAEADNTTLPRSLQVGSVCSEEAEYNMKSEQLDTLPQRLTDGGFEESVNAYCFYARQHYVRGEQVLLSYGMYTNLELLEHYGFLLDNNPNDKVYIPLEPGVSSCSSWPTESLYINQGGEPSYALLSTLRLWATPSNQRRSVGHLAYSGSQLSPENEMRVMHLMLKCCSTILHNLPTSIEDDQLLLCTLNQVDGTDTPVQLFDVLSKLGAESHAFLETLGLRSRASVAVSMSWKIQRQLERWKLAVQWRLRYKRTLVDCITYCSNVIDRIHSPVPRNGMC